MSASGASQKLGFRDIVVGIDFSEQSHAAAARASVLARAWGGRVHLVHAVGLPVLAISSELAVPPSVWASVRLQAEEQLGALRDELATEGLVVTASVYDGDPVNAIKLAQTAHHADLLALGTHGRGGLAGLLLGSVAQRSVRSLEGPVLIVREPLTSAAEPIRRILLAVDFSRDSEQAAALAVEVAGHTSAEVDVMHVLETPDWLAAGLALDLEERLREQASEGLARITADFERAGVKAALRLESGTIADTIADEAKRLGAQLIIMGTQGRTGLKHMLLGSVAERTIHLADCSVLTIRAADEDA